MNISLNIIDFLILFLALQGLVLGVLLCTRAGRLKSNRWLAAFIFVIAETTLLMELMASGYLDEHPGLLPYIPILRLLIGPLIYFYARSLVYGQVGVAKRYYLHFLTVIVDAKYQVIFLFYVTGLLKMSLIRHFYFSPAVQSFLFNQTALSNLPTLLSLIIYSALSFRLVRRGLAAPDISIYKHADLKWLRNLISLFFGVIGVFVVTIAFSVKTGGWDYYMLYLAVTGFVYWLGMSAYIRQSKMSGEDISAYNKASAKSYFSEEDAKKYLVSLLSLMENDRLYLNPVLKIEDLAEKLILNQRLTSALLNKHTGKTFNDFVNTYRVEEAKKRLPDPAYRQFTIAAIAVDCGFNSLATFQRCFKQFTGITPSQYQKQEIVFNTAQMLLKS